MVFDIGFVIPMDRMNVVIQVSFPVLLQKIRNINDAQELSSRLRLNPQIDAKQGIDCNIATRLFQNFTGTGFLRRLAGLDVSTRLSYHQGSGRSFFNNQEFAVLFHDGGNCQISR